MDSNQSPVSVWHYKPWWCQPWSILLTGVALIGGSWLFLKLIWVTVLVAIPVLTWMGFFLLVYPQLMKAELAGYDRSDAEKLGFEQQD